MLVVAVMMAVTELALATASMPFLTGLPLWARSEYYHDHSETLTIFE